MGAGQGLGRRTYTAGGRVRQSGFLVSAASPIRTSAASNAVRQTQVVEMTWHGSIVGFVPYDLRMPSAARFRERLWAPEDSRVFTPQVFGVGWTVNIGRVATLLRRRG
jgi:Family of unknown function (DUF5808)